MRRLVCVVMLALGVGCSAAQEGEGPVVHSHDFPALSIGAYEEFDGVCQSWTLDNDEPIYLNKVVMDAGPMWHHSNWFFVPESLYDGEDGTWNCGARNFDEFSAALSGGVLYAMSTQASHEIQEFAEGAVLVIPPRSRVVGDVHLLNYTGEDIPETRISFELHDMPDYDIALKAMSLVYRPLDIPPKSVSRFEGHCDLTAHTSSGPAEFNIYYLLPHYHYLGTGMDVSVSGSGGITEVFTTDLLAGDPLGKTLDPPLQVSQATELNFSCTYNNTTDSRVGWGIGDQEMCVFLAFTDDTHVWAGGVAEDNTVDHIAEDGTVVNTGPCDVFRL